MPGQAKCASSHKWKIQLRRGGGAGFAFYELDLNFISKQKSDAIRSERNADPQWKKKQSQTSPYKSKATKNLHTVFLCTKISIL